MKILVCSKLSIPARKLYLPDWRYAENIGHQITIMDRFHPTERPDAVILMGIGALQCAVDALKAFPSVPLYVYNWDCYTWCWENPRQGEYNYKGYYEFLTLAKEVWSASSGTALRTKEVWGQESKVILCNCPTWESRTQDDGYVLYALRQVPDPAWGVFEQACKELGIPYSMTRHNHSYENYQKKVANCRFIVSDLYEMSTGGLTLMEAYYVGKPCLLTDSKWHGGKDYMGNRATYFQHGNFEDYKNKLWEMFTHTPVVPLDHKEYITSNFSNTRMIDQMLERVRVCSESL